MSAPCPPEAPSYYTFILHCIAIVSAPINMLALYLVLYKSPGMSKYKYGICYLQVSLRRIPVTEDPGNLTFLESEALSDQPFSAGLLLNRTSAIHRLPWLLLLPTPCRIQHRRILRNFPPWSHLHDNVDLFSGF